MKHKTNYWSAAAAFFCTVTVLLSLLPSAVFADYPSQEEGEEIVEEVPSNEGNSSLETQTVQPEKTRASVSYSPLPRIFKPFRSTAGTTSGPSV